MNSRLRIAALALLAAVAVVASSAAQQAEVGNREPGARLRRSGSGAALRVGNRTSDFGPPCCALRASQGKRTSDLPAALFELRRASGLRTSLLRSSSFAGQADLESPPQADEEHHSRGARIAGWLRAAGWSDDAIVFSIAMLPIVELRGAIPVGIGFLHMPWWRAFLWAVAGNMLPVPFILWLLGPMARLGMKIPIGARFLGWLFERTRRKTASVERYETLGLAVFVAVPLPVTGAWTGSVAGFLMDLRRGHAMASIFLGVLIAGVIMTVLSVLGWLGAILAGVGLLAAAVGGLQRSLRREEMPRADAGSSQS